MTPTHLDPLRFPLHGSRLIEASAGTGKTFTIAALYLRLVLGHGEADTAFARPLTPPQILVVTFTDAATKELRDRIRARLAEAAQSFLADPAQVVARAPGEDLLHDLRAQYPAQDWALCARRLQLAAEWMDEAAVSTIHGWCNRMLREHAFDSGSLFTQHLEADQSELLAEAVRDYWRCFLVPLPEVAALPVQRWWPTPQDLQQEVQRLLPHVSRLPAAPAPAQALGAWVQQLAALKAPWGTWVDELRALLDEAAGRNVFNGRFIRKDWYESWLRALVAWRDDPLLVQPDLKKGWERLTPGGLRGACRDAAQAPQHPALQGIEALHQALQSLVVPRPAVLSHAAGWICQRFAQERERRAQMGFDDLLTQLDAALAGPNGQRLAEAIRAQFPVALIDEFQDTDAVQYRIFDAVYRVSDNAPDTALVLIGDPKQAIYAFRGADIHTYLAARAATAGRLYTLRRNFRSTHALVAATNACFELAEQRPGGPGAFLFRSNASNPVPFLPAEAQGRADALHVDGRPALAMTLWHLGIGEDGAVRTKGDYIATMAQLCAAEMARLLNLGRRGAAGFGASGSALRALRPGDLAVLVNNRHEAAAIREALSARGVRSVYLSESECVYQRPEALEVQRWLAACAAPDDARALRAALATPTLDLDWASLDRLNHDELAWDERVQQFRAYQACWRRQGVLPMLRRLLHDFDVPGRLLAAGAGGERRLTDLLHLAELLQQASSALDGEHALMRFLAQQRQEASGGSGDERQLRLESDADLVQVVTVHKSKGLEYPLVFLPFACCFRATEAADVPLAWHDEHGRLQLDLQGDAQALARADDERLGEDLRKLYVALTRARYAIWIGVAPLDGLPRSAVGHLLGAHLGAGLQALGAACPHVEVLANPQPGAETCAWQEQAAALGAARVAPRRAHEHWWIASYSALQAQAADSPDTAQEDVYRESAAAQAETQVPAQTPPPGPPTRPPQPAAAGALHGLRGSADTGTFLHGLLEWAARRGFERTAADPAALRDLVARRCAVRDWQPWINPLCAWMQDFLQRPLAVPGLAPFTLASLRQPVAEMEFWTAVHNVDVAQLDELVCRHTLGGRPRPPLQPAQLNGLLKGFIDLVAEHDGRYYVIDYKSNRLGADDTAYGAESLACEVAAQRYDVQSVLYLLALHRLLRARLPGYRYEEHVGGALCLFLRGSQAVGGGVHAERPPYALIEALDRLFARRTATETT